MNGCYTKRDFLGYFWRGKSVLDGKPIVCIFTGFSRKSKNSKTGNMIQTWILREDVSPAWAEKSGCDYSICGNCRQRHFLGGTCYVSPGRAPTTVFKAYHRGRYLPLEGNDYLNSLEMEMFRGKVLRIGTYGDPIAVPTELWDGIIADGKLHAWTGYTHQWRHPASVTMRRVLMASVDSEQEFQEATSMGWFCFRNRKCTDALLPRERVCPASAEAGHRTTCNICCACDGNRGNRVIVTHGYMARKGN